MNDLLRRFVSETQAGFEGRLRTPVGLLKRQASQDELLDTAVLSGYSVSDILSGTVLESDLDPKVVHAFHLQYPNAGDFVEFVREHEGDHAALNGIVQAVKGKLFEVEYVDWLNDGHLPDGATAELASRPTQEGWDIVVRDSHGHVAENLQLKATESLGYIKEAIATHPDIDVVATREVLQHFDGSGLEDHITVSDISNDQLSENVREQIHGAELVPEFHVPLLAFGIIALQNYRRYRRGNLSAGEAIESGFRRGWRILLCRGAAYASVLMSHEPVIGLPVSVLTRTTFSRFDVQNQFGILIEQYNDSLRETREQIYVYRGAQLVSH